jgi:hypothetical protein
LFLVNHIYIYIYAVFAPRGAFDEVAVTLHAISSVMLVEVSISLVTFLYRSVNVFHTVGSLSLCFHPDSAEHRMNFGTLGEGSSQSMTIDTTTTILDRLMCAGCRKPPSVESLRKSTTQHTE